MSRLASWTGQYDHCSLTIIRGGDYSQRAMVHALLLCAYIYTATVKTYKLNTELLLPCTLGKFRHTCMGLLYAQVEILREFNGTMQCFRLDGGLPDKEVDARHTRIEENNGICNESD